MALLPLARQLRDAFEVPRDLALGRYPEFVTGGPLARGDIPIFVFHSLEPVSFERRLRYLDEPARVPRAGALPVLILPGHTARLEDYDPLVAPLSAERRVLLADLPGKGYAEKKYRAWFVGMAPIGHPRIIVAVMVDEPTAGAHFGGDVAGPVFSDLVQQTLRTLNVPPDLEVRPQIVARDIPAEEESF